MDRVEGLPRTPRPPLDGAASPRATDRSAHHPGRTAMHQPTLLRPTSGTPRIPYPENGRDAFSPLRLARMRAALKRHIDSGQIPGLVALVHHRGREHVEVIGTMALDG